MLAALADPPRCEKQLLELRLDWDEGGDGSQLELEESRRWAAAHLRVFLLTWDPFEWLAERGPAFATTARRPDGTGLVLYVPHWRALHLAGGQPHGIAAVLGQLGESVLSVAGEYRQLIVDGGYPSAVRTATAPPLLSRIPATPILATPGLSLAGAGWQAIGFDVLEDLAQDAFGPAELDRSPVRFSRRGSAARCPGCRGASVEFPDGLGAAQDALCDLHRPEALRITTARLEAARASNPVGWDALVEAGQRLLEPHLPDGLGPRLLAAATGTSVDFDELLAASDGKGTPEDRAARVAVVTEAAAKINGLPEPDAPLGRRLAPVRAWLAAFPDELTAAGDEELAAQARAGAEVLLGTASGAAADAAPAPAVAAAALDAAADAPADLPPSPADGGGEVAAPPPKPEPYRRPQRVGRNALCPCGSGKKYKFCHG